MKFTASKNDNRRHYHSAMSHDARRTYAVWCADGQYVANVYTSGPRGGVSSLGTFSCMSEAVAAANRAEEVAA
jgi:hypothetical protein